MSENSEVLSPKTRVHRNRTRRRLNRERLPTPPPDPTALEESTDKLEGTDKDAQFLEYITSLQKMQQLQFSRSESMFAPVGVAEDAFDHLDKLYKLMEQMLNLKQQNAKLQRRIRDLEYIKNLDSLNRNLGNVTLFEDIPELDDNSSFNESLLDAMLMGTKKDIKYKPWSRSRLRQSLMKKQRIRSSSMNEKMNSFEAEAVPDLRRSSAFCDRKKTSKVSKWTKVKAAFRWEKASPSVSGAKSQDSGISGMQPVNYELARYLRVPSTSDELGVSPADSGAADGSTPGTLSSASSTDDVQRLEHRNNHADAQISDDDHHSINLTDDRLARGGSSSNNSSSKSWLRTKSKESSLSQDKNRLSARCEAIRIDVSDNEDLLEIDQNRVNNEDRAEIPEAILARYKEVIAEDEKTSKQNFGSKHASKWTRVKKAFLTPPAVNSVHDNKSKLNHRSTSFPVRTQKETHFKKDDDNSKRVQDEIQRNYRQLQNKLSLEFQNKLQEWEKLKSGGISNVSGVHARSDGTSDDQKDQAFIKKMEEWQRIKSQPSKHNQSIQMIREENLAPEFKKKLEEWQKIKKCSVKDDCASAKTKRKLGEWPKWKSVSGHRDEPAVTETPPLSDDFLKKLEEWKKIKEANKHEDTKEKTPSPKAVKKANYENPQAKLKEHNEGDLQWFETELNKIEREKQRLEQERQKFLQREERLTKLRRAVMGDETKKDVLIHTPSGFYRFEGISRKFTQKLCEWEKAQGIGPEASTFALLTSTFTPRITVDLYDANSQAQNLPYNNTRLLRSKSAESICTINTIQPCPSSSHHPSSLSLNDVEELEKQCLSLSRNSSMQDMDISLEKLREDEPEAVIVEVEDVEEETAALLEECMEEKHFPIYQRENALNIYEEQPCVIPYLQRIDPKSSQYSSFLIGDIQRLLTSLENQEGQQWKKEYQVSDSDEFMEDASYYKKNLASPDVMNSKTKYFVQKERSDMIFEKLSRLQEVHSKIVLDILSEDESSTANFSSILEEAQDLFLELFQLTEQLQNIIATRCKDNFSITYFDFEDCSYSNVLPITTEFTTKLNDLRRILTYLYAASDMTAPGHKSTKKQTKIHLNIVNVEHDQIGNNTIKLSHNESEKQRLLTKRSRYKKKDYTTQTICVMEDSDISEHNPKISSDENFDDISVDPIIVERLVIPTKTNFVNVICEPITTNVEITPVDVLVKTTKKLFTAVPETQNLPSINLLKTDAPADEEDVELTVPIQLPPLPPSPIPQRKTSKEISPSIRIMLAKYNQMISQQDTTGTSKSAASSGSASPIAWRSPVSERRVKAQREKYIQEISRKADVKKSASTTGLNSDKKLFNSNNSNSFSCAKLNKGILRSTSASVIQNDIEINNINQQRNLSLKLIIPEPQQTKSFSERHSNLQRAKEKFLNSSPNKISSPSSAPPALSLDTNNKIHTSGRSRYSQISMGSESSYESNAYEGLLVKSASAGMINVDEDTYKQIDPAFHRDGYVSLPRSAVKQKEGLLGGKLTLSNIAAKFRKVKMRKNKEHKKMNTVSALCRQSLVVNISPENSECGSQEKEKRRDSLTVPLDRGASSSEETSPASSRSGSWIRRSKIFKAL